MARGQIPVTDIVRAGVAPAAQTDADATNDHYFINADGRVFLEIVSSDGSQQTVAIQPAPGLTADGLTVSALTITIPAGVTRVCGPFRVATFKQNASYHLYLDPSVSTTLKFRAYRLPEP